MTEHLRNADITKTKNTVIVVTRSVSAAINGSAGFRNKNTDRIHLIRRK